MLPPPEDDPSRSPALLAPLPRRGPGVRRLNKVPVLIFIGGICLVVSAIGYTYKVRLASSAAAVTEGNAKPQSANGAAVLNGAPMAGEIQSAVFRPALLPPKLPPEAGLPTAPAQVQMGQPRDASGQQPGQDDDPAVQARKQAWQNYYQQLGALQMSRQQDASNALKADTTPNGMAGSGSGWLASWRRCGPGAIGHRTRHRGAGRHTGINCPTGCCWPYAWWPGCRWRLSNPATRRT